MCDGGASWIADADHHFGRAGRDEQDVCWRERMSGTSRMVTRCGTEKERDQAREGARDFLQRPKICSGPGCG